MLLGVALIVDVITTGDTEAKPVSFDSDSAMLASAARAGSFVRTPLLTVIVEVVFQY